MTGPNVGPLARLQGEQSAPADFPTKRELRRRQGQSYARTGERTAIGALTGKSPKSVHLRVHGERRVCYVELHALAKSRDPKVNPYQLLADQHALVEGARREIAIPELVRSAITRSLAEQESDGSEDSAQLAAHAALSLLQEKGPDRLSFQERARVRQSIERYKAKAIDHLAASLALVGDLEAICVHLQERH